MPRLNFTLEKTAKNSRARATRFRTLHNEVLTPVFMPVATMGSVRGQSMNVVLEAGSQVLLANTFHLLIRPGVEVFKQFSGIHNFIQWPKSVLTDSGGFQIFAMNEERTMNEEAAIFKNYVNGDLVHLSPEQSIATQRAIGSDIMMVLDQCVPSTCDRWTAQAAMQLTHRWARRSLAARGDSPQSMFGIIQGACYQDLRRESARFLTELPFDGFAIGGLAVGETRSEREDFTAIVTETLPENLPRYLMGVGTPIDLLEAVHRGVDMFDCILPNALAQQGVAFGWMGKLNLRKAQYRLEKGPLDPACSCPVCKVYSRAYLHHLIKCSEPLGWELIGAHNLYFYHELTRAMRTAILEDRFYEFYLENKPKLELRDEQTVAVKKHAVAPHTEKISQLSLGDYEIIENKGGFAAIRQKSSGEIMHSSGDPWGEAEHLYVDQSALLSKAQMESVEALIVWDVGLGAATNAMATILALEKLGDKLRRKVKIISFENDLDSLRLALREPELFTHLKHAAPRVLLEQGEWRHGPIEWKLIAGDFAKLFPNAILPDIVYYDPFSFKVDAPLWSWEFFTELHAVLRHKYCELFTYSASTAVRAALLAAGFHVAEGATSGPKVTTTIGITGPDLKLYGPRKYLADEWLKRWERSNVRVPPSIRNHEQKRRDFESLIYAHPHFQKRELPPVPTTDHLS